MNFKRSICLFMAYWPAVLLASVPLQQQQSCQSILLVYPQCHTLLRGNNPPSTTLSNCHLQLLSPAHYNYYELQLVQNDTVQPCHIMSQPEVSAIQTNDDTYQNVRIEKFLLLYFAIGLYGTYGCNVTWCSCTASILKTSLYHANIMTIL